MQCNFEYIEQFAADVTFFSSQYGKEGSSSYTVSNIIGVRRIFPSYADRCEACVFRTYGDWWTECPSSLRPIGGPGAPDHLESCTDFVDVFFERPVIPSSVRIFETHQPGAIVRILGCYREAEPANPVGTRGLKWRTLWRLRTPDSRFQSYKYSDYLRRDDIRALQRVMSAQTDRVRDDDELLPPAIQASTQSRARMFEPPLENVPLMPLDLIRIELDCTLVSSYTELDAVLLCGWARVPHIPGAAGIWPRKCLSLPPPVTMRSFIDEQLVIQQYILPRQSFFMNVDQSGHSLQRASSFVNQRALPPVFTDAALTDDARLMFDQPVSMLDCVGDALYWAEPPPSHVRIEELPPEDELGGSFKALTCASRRPSVDSSIQLAGALVPYPWPNALVPRPESEASGCEVDGERFCVADLPYELLLAVFGYLDLVSLCRCAPVCRLFCQASNDTLASLTELNLRPFWAQLRSRSLVALGVRLTARSNTVAVPPPLNFRMRSSHVNTIYARVAHLQARVAQRPSLECDTQPSVANAIVPYQHKPRPLINRRRRCWSSSVTHDFEFIGGGERKEAANALMEAGGSGGGRSMPAPPPYPGENPFLRRAKPRLQRLDLSWSGCYDKISSFAFGRFLADVGGQLTTLRVSACPFIDDDCLLIIVNKCPRLRELDLSSCNNVTPEGLNPLGRLLELRWLNLYRCRVVEENLNNMASMLQQLEHLNLGSCSMLDGSDAAFLRLINANPCIRSLNLWRCKFMTDATVRAISDLCPELEEIELGWCHRIQSQGDVVEYLARRGHGRIKKLFLTAIRGLTANDFAGIAEHLADSLEQLDTLGNSQLDVELAERILVSCRQLRLFDLSYCPEIKWSHVTDWKKRFPHCFLQYLTSDGITVSRDRMDDALPRAQPPPPLLQFALPPPNPQEADGQLADLD